MASNSLMFILTLVKIDHLGGGGTYREHGHLVCLLFTLKKGSGQNMIVLPIR